MVVIRLRRAGSKKRPFFRVVVTDSRAARDSSFVEILGHYNPRTKPALVEVDQERVDYWIKQGRAAVRFGPHADRAAPDAGRRRPHRRRPRPSDAMSASARRAVVEVLARALTDRPDEVHVIESEHKGTTLVELYVGARRARTRDRQAGPDGGRAAHAGRDGGREGRQDRHARDPRRTSLMRPWPPNWDEMALVGRIARAHGIRGQVIVNPETDFPEERFQAGRGAVRRRGDGASQAADASRRVRFQQERPVIGLDGVDDDERRRDPGGRRAAGAGRRAGCRCREGTFYRHDLVGCAVETGGGRWRSASCADGRGRRSVGSRLVVAGEGGEVLVPLVDGDLHDRSTRRRRRIVDRSAGRAAGAECANGRVACMRVRHRHDLSGDGRAGARRPVSSAARSSAARWP